MATDLNPLRSFDLTDLRARLASRQEWEEDPLDAAKFGTAAWKLGFGHFGTDDIRALWRIGILRADFVSSEDQNLVPGFVPVAAQDGNHRIDVRTITPRREGERSFVPEGEAVEDRLAPYFHPYKLYALHHVVRTLRVSTSSTQFVRWTPGVLNVVEWELRGLRRWTESQDFIDRFDHWNRVSEIAALCQPLRHLRRPSTSVKPFVMEAWLEDYAERLGVLLRTIPMRQILDLREELGRTASERDGNSRIHTLLRLMKRFERDRIEGHIGSAMKFLDMAESIRRAAEFFWDTQLPEEDEIGSGMWFEGARKTLYGTERVFDAKPKELRNFLGMMGLDLGIKVRCYVEGATELGALNRVAGAPGQCVFVNLKGQVVERNGKGLALRDSMMADMANHIFSFVALDADREDVSRMLRRAAANEEFHGAFRLFEPDFELANFSVSELLLVALQMSSMMRDKDLDVTQEHFRILPAVASARSGKQFFRLFHDATGMTEVDKGEDWGAALIEHALSHRQLPAEHPQTGERPVIEFVRMLLRAQEAGFSSSLTRERVDPVSGDVKARPEN